MDYPPLVEHHNLVDRLGQNYGPTDLGRIVAALDDASALVRSHARKSWVTTGGVLETVPDGIQVATLAVARRLYENPRGLVSESTGPFAGSYGPDAAEPLRLTATERAMIDAALPSPTAGVWTLSTTRAEVIDPDGMYDSDDWEIGEHFDPVPTRGVW